MQDEAAWSVGPPPASRPPEPAFEGLDPGVPLGEFALAVVDVLGRPGERTADDSAR